MQPDTIAPNLTAAQSWNRFSYGLNNPSRYTDPTGHKPCWATSKYSCNLTQEIADREYGKYSAKDRPAVAAFFASHGFAIGGGGGIPGSAFDYQSVVGSMSWSSSSSCTSSMCFTRQMGSYSGSNCGTGPIACVWNRITSGPDYILLNVNIPIFWGIGGVDLQLARDYYNNWYWAVGPGASAGPSYSLNFGWLLREDRPEEALEGFILRHTVFAGGGFIGGGGLTWGDPSLVREAEIKDFALEVELTNPGGGGAYVYGMWIYDNGDPTPWFWQHDG
jgi:hypothetical protein